MPLPAAFPNSSGVIYERSMSLYCLCKFSCTLHTPIWDSHQYEEDPFSMVSQQTYLSTPLSQELFVTHGTCSHEIHNPARERSGKRIPGRGNSVQEVYNLGVTPNPPALLQPTAHAQATSAHPRRMGTHQA